MDEFYGERVEGFRPGPQSTEFRERIFGYAGGGRAGEESDQRENSAAIGPASGALGIWGAVRVAVEHCADCAGVSGEFVCGVRDRALSEVSEADGGGIGCDRAGG